ncbi:MAG: hypothetical protein ACRDZ7_04510 [Acidimicrobiia bacterium]
MRKRWVMAVAVVAVLAVGCGADQQAQTQSTTEGGSAATDGASSNEAGGAGMLRTILGPGLEGLLDPTLFAADVGSDGSIYALVAETVPPDPGSTRDTRSSLLVVPPDGGNPRLIAKEGTPGFEDFYPSDVAVKSTGAIYVYDDIMELVTVVRCKGHPASPGLYRRRGWRPSSRDI